MESNFDFLRATKMCGIANAARDAEKAFQIGPGACCLLCRRAAEYALHWMLANDSELQKEFSDESNKAHDRAEMSEMLNSRAFRNRIPHKSIINLDNIRISGNTAAHRFKEVQKHNEAEKCLTCLHFVLLSLSIKYGGSDKNPSMEFDRSILYPKRSPNPPGKNALPPRVAERKNASLQLYVHTFFTDAFDALTSAEKQDVDKVVRRMKHRQRINPGHMPVPGAEDENIFMLPVDKRFKLYIVFYWAKNVCALLHVAEKEKAARWGKTIKCEVNEITNSLQVFQVVKPGFRDITPEMDQIQENLDEIYKPGVEFLFRHIDAEDLLRLGIPEEYIREIYDTTKETWPAMKARLSGQAFDCLSMVLNGVPLERVIKETYNRNRKLHSHEIEVAANNAQAELVKIKSEDDLTRMLEAPLEKWRVFLHPQQRYLAYRHYDKPARVFGGAGTGKSVVAIHHAKYLASESPPEYKILFTTYTRTLTRDLEARLRSICSDQELKKIEVINLDGLIRRLLGKINRQYKDVQYDEGQINDAWENAIKLSGVAFDSGSYNREFFKEEWIYVIQAQDISNMEAYINADRQGRGMAINPEARKKLWKVFRRYANIMKEERWLDRDAAANCCCHELEKNPSLQQYDSIIVDESPDFGPSQFRLLRALCGKPHADDLFITGDPRQQIYSNKPKLVLSRCGIDVRGRSHQLLLNYRTTGNILKWANRLLQDIEYDDLDGGPAESETTVSSVEGEKPELRHFETAGQEENYVKDKIQSLLDRGVRPCEIAVMARAKYVLNEHRQVLRGANIPVDEGKENDAAKDVVRLLTMHKAKGLEFSYVFIVSVNKKELPNRKAIEETQDEAEKKRRINQEKQVLHVALTRARIQVYLSYSGEPSEFIKLLERE